MQNKAMFTGKKDSPAVIFVIVVAVFMLLAISNIFNGGSSGKATTQAYESVNLRSVDMIGLTDYVSDYDVVIEDYIVGEYIEINQLISEVEDRGGSESKIRSFVDN